MPRPTICLLLPLALLAACREQPQAYYATSAEAVVAGAFARGWLPEVLNADASDIREVHDIDSNRGSAEFRYAPGLIPRLKHDCDSMPALNDQIAYQCGSFTIRLDPMKHRGTLSHD